MKVLLVFILLFSTAFAGNILAQKEQVIVVIDPGHGGKDPGHLSNNVNLLSEKALNLKIAHFLGGYIEKYLQNVKVIYTRTTDVYPSLNDRVSKANANNADYFISIHCNGNDRKSVRGTESHVHSMHLTKSVALAKEIEIQFSQRAGRKSRGVKDMRDLKHTLQVLKHTNMTSVLVECGFLTNLREAKYLNTTQGQEVIASAIFRGFRSTIVKEFPAISFMRAKDAVRNSDVASGGQFTIQIMSSINPIDTKDSAFKRLKMSVDRKELNTTKQYKYIYTVGLYDSKKEAQTTLKKVQSRGYKDAIVVKA